MAVAVATCGVPGDSDQGGGGSAAADSASAADSSAVTDSSAADPSDSSAAGDDAVPVEIATVEQGDISSYLVFSSTVETEAAVEIHPEVSGRVEEVLAEEGDQVEAGQVLVRLDDDQARLEDRQSAIELRHLEGAFERIEELHRRRLVSAQEYEDKLYQLEQARLRREQARLTLAHTRIEAPFTGVLTSRRVQLGARVGPGNKLFDLVKLDDMIARVYVPGRYLREVAVGQLARVVSDFIPHMVFEGYVKRISPVVDPKSGTFKVTVGLRDRWEHLRPGIFVSVQIVTDTHRAAVLVPKEAVVYDGTERFVFVVDEGTARRIQLEAGYENARFVEALRGIAVGTPVIVVGQNGLRDQARVRVVTTEAPSDQTPAADQG